MCIICIFFFCKWGKWIVVGNLTKLVEKLAMLNFLRFVELILVCLNRGTIGIVC